MTRPIDVERNVTRLMDALRSCEGDQPIIYTSSMSLFAGHVGTTLRLSKDAVGVFAGVTVKQDTDRLPLGGRVWVIEDGS